MKITTSNEFEHLAKSLSRRVLTGLLSGFILLPALASAETTATSPLRKVKDVVIYANRKFHSAFPSVVVRPDGEMLCAFRRAPSRRILLGTKGDNHTDANSYLVMSRSSDSGNTWSEPSVFYAHAFGGSQDPCMLQLSDNSIICMSYGWMPLPPETGTTATETPRLGRFGFLGGYVLRSEDGAKTWQGPFTPMVLPGTSRKDPMGNPIPAYNRGQLMQASDGSILWAVARQDKKTSVHLIRSVDKGETWTYMSEIASDPKVTFNETSLVEASNGDIIALLRTDGLGKRLAMARSRDGGKSFEKWEDLGFVGEPMQGVRLKDGRILVVYGYRQPKQGTRARVFSADLSDAKTAPEFIIRDDGVSGDLGYPWATLMPNGQIFVAYYHSVGDNPPHIAGSILEVD